MNIPNFPTDNLYKFAALAGVSTMLFSMYINYRMVELFFKSAEEALVETATHLREAMANLTEPVLTEKQGIINAKRDAFNWRYGHMRTVRWLCTVFMVIGLVVAGWGFTNWSWRVQRYQDELLRLQVQAARQEASATPAHP